ncbi:uncharacterized protein [Solanum tuberosum]|uniref:uncharacterized protein n=1 Tax=Solanum tuberosum TaxID=4113 RepID=UPI00073A054C|nr:PREDICTED: uncharacterized protein LOC107062322 [Solanum tuberosum]
MAIGTDQPTLTAETQQTQIHHDSNNALYVHPSENAGSSITPVVFDGTGYRSWRRGILRALSVKNKTGFINGKIEKPAPTSPTYDQWERCDNMVTSWILNSLSKDLADSLQYVNNAKELWEELEDRYDQANGAKLYQIQQELSNLTQGNLDVTGYYTNIKRLWEELATLDVTTQCTCSCTCGGKNKLHKAEQDRRLIQFLMGLNEVYTVVRGSILMMNPLPTMAQTFSILVQEEKQREVKPHSRVHLDSTSLNVSASSSSGSRHSIAGNNTSTFRTNYTPNRGGGKGVYKPNPTSNSSSGYYAGSSSNSGNSFRTYPPNHNKSNLLCDYCKKSGHTEEKCYRLHGFPQDFKFTKGRNSGSAANVHGNSRSSISEKYEEQENNLTHSLTQDQYNQLLNLLGNIHVHGEATNDGHRDSVDNLANGHGAVNLAGILACHSSITEFGKLSCKCVASSAASWIIDSGATNHMTYNKALLTRIRPLAYPFLVTLPNGYKVKVTEIGDAYLNSALTLYQGPSLKSPLEIGSAKDGLYFTC